MKKFFLTIIIYIFGFTAFSSVQASSVIFNPNINIVQVGKTFTLPIIIDPADLAQYTVRLAITFPPESLEVISFTFGQNWLALSQPGYDSLNNTLGEIIKTAGFPKGFSSPLSFGTITFRAKKVGESVVNVGASSFILDAQNKDTLASRPQMQVSVTQASVPQTSPIQPTESVSPQAPTGGPPLFDIISEPVVVKVAPGELLPIEVNLSNFGEGKRVDVLIEYSIFTRAGDKIYSTNETVAVETTANFIKTIQIPYGTTPGIYVARTSIIYQGQVVPASTEFPFTVERKILGIFQSIFFIYGSVIIIVGVLMLLLGRALVKRHRKARLTPFDYSNIPHGERTFYEILSDTIMTMRGRVGEEALLIASHIPGLSIDKGTGRVLAMTEPPAKIIATLVSEYENLLGKKVSFSFRKDRTGV